MKITRAARSSRNEMFTTLEREHPPTSFSIAFTNTAADPRIDAAFFDYMDASRGFLGTVWHYVIKVDGSIEIARDPRRVTSRTSNFFVNREALHIGIVGGIDPETCERSQTTTPEQEEALEELMQAIASALNVPIEVHDARQKWTRSQPAAQDNDQEPDQDNGQEHDHDHDRDEADEALEAALDQAEAMAVTA